MPLGGRGDSRLLFSTRFHVKRTAAVKCVSVLNPPHDDLSQKRNARVVKFETLAPVTARKDIRIFSSPEKAGCSPKVSQILEKEQIESLFCSRNHSSASSNSFRPVSSFASTYF
jgi:hypothetical protein